MTPEVLKVIVLVVLLSMTFLLGIIPIKVFEKLRERARTRSTSLAGVADGRPRNARKPLYRRVMSLMSCYAAGVFLATCILDLLPDVRHQLIRVLFSMSIFTGFPVAEFVTSFGFFVLLIIEQFVLMIKETELRKNGERKPLLSERNVDGDEEDDKSLTESLSGISDRPITPDGDREDPFRNHHHHHHHHHHGLEEDDEHHHSVLRSLVLLLALSLHSVFEGLAVGLQREAQQVLQIFAALVLHKSILSFSLGMNLVQSQLRHKAIIQSILLFSITSPIGIGIGIGIVDLWDSIWSSLIQGILQGLACGTFLYVTFFEVLPHEFNTRDDRILKLLFLLLGYITITAIMFLDADIGKPFCAIGSLSRP